MDESDGTVSVLVVDAHTLFRDGLRMMFASLPGVDVVGLAGDARRAVDVAARTRPDVVLLDHDTPGTDLLTTVDLIRERSPDSAVLVLGALAASQHLRALLTAGIRGYLPKDATPEQLVSTVRCVSGNRDRVVLSVSRRSIDTMVDLAGSRLELSDRERQVLVLAAQALSNSQIATRLSLTEATVKRHLRSVFGKLGAVSRIDAVNKAIVASLIPAGPVAGTATPAVAPRARHTA